MSGTSLNKAPCNNNVADNPTPLPNVFFGMYCFFFASLQLYFFLVITFLAIHVNSIFQISFFVTLKTCYTYNGKFFKVEKKEWTEDKVKKQKIKIIFQITSIINSKNFIIILNCLQSFIPTNYNDKFF